MIEINKHDCLNMVFGGRPCRCFCGSLEDGAREYFGRLLDVDMCIMTCTRLMGAWAYFECR